MKIIIVGGGPAGMLAAVAASKSNIESAEKVKEPSQVILIEKNEKLGKKLFITGKGRCNLTNNCSREDFFKNIVRNPKFLYSAFSEFSNIDLQKLVEENGCPLKIERGNRVFPVSDKSYDVIDALKKAVKKAGVKVSLNTEVVSINICDDKDNKVDEDKSKFKIITNNNKTFYADKVIVATGGLAYPSTGSTGDGYKFAKDFGINVINQSPSLVPLNVKEVSECKMMQGLTLKNVGIKIIDSNQKIIYKDFGEMLFTHFGVSGPIILSASCYIEECDGLILSIDLKPALSEKQLDERLLREFDENKNKKLKSILENLLPSSMVEPFIDRISKLNYDNLAQVTASNVDKTLRQNIVKLLKDYRYVVKSKRGYDEAVVTRGGIDVKEINPKTMESKKVPGLYFVGEVLDIDALTGGFNIQISATTGFACGKNIA